MKLETIKKAVEELNDAKKESFSLKLFPKSVMGPSPERVAGSSLKGNFRVPAICSLLTNSMKHKKNGQDSETVALL
ncbi:MAG: hypothetical protein SWH78_09080 [Thermodesulfobacteriota bacterium]|nr:hypothetical protein [Thermodesulfobacteriota bacterium]